MKTVGIFGVLMFTVASFWFLTQAMLPVQAQTKAVWDYTCYESPGAVVNFLNTLPAMKSERAKLFHHAEQKAISVKLFYCVAYWK